MSRHRYGVSTHHPGRICKFMAQVDAKSSKFGAERQLSSRPTADQEDSTSDTVVVMHSKGGHRSWTYRGVWYMTSATWPESLLLARKNLHKPGRRNTSKGIASAVKSRGAAIDRIDQA